MQSGKLRQRVTVQLVTQTQDSYGEPVESWAEIDTVWAEVKPATGQERFVASADQQLATLTHVVNMRYLDGLSPVNHRLLWGTRVLDIETVQDPTGRTATTKLLCREELETGTITAIGTAGRSIGLLLSLTYAS